MIATAWKSSTPGRRSPRFSTSGIPTRPKSRDFASRCLLHEGPNRAGTEPDMDLVQDWRPRFDSKQEHGHGTVLTARSDVDWKRRFFGNCRCGSLDALAGHSRVKHTGDPVGQEDTTVIRRCQYCKTQRSGCSVSRHNSSALKSALRDTSFSAISGAPARVASARMSSGSAEANGPPISGCARLFRGDNATCRRCILSPECTNVP